MKKTVCLFLALTLALLLCAASFAEEEAAALTSFEATEEPDPYVEKLGAKFEFTTTDLDGNTVSSADLFSQNKATLVNVWTTWCVPCIGEMEELQAIHTLMQKNGGGVVGMLMDDDLDAARALITAYGITYPVILAPDNMDDFMHIDVFPTSLFFARNGTMAEEPIAGVRVERYITVLNDLLRQ